MLIRDYIKELILESINSCHKNGILPIFEIDQIEVERPQNTDNGDFAVSLPLKLTKVLKSNPLEIANTLTTYIDNEKANIVFDKILLFALFSPIAFFFPVFSNLILGIFVMCRYSERCF